MTSGDPELGKRSHEGAFHYLRLHVTFVYSPLARNSHLSGIAQLAASKRGRPPGCLVGNQHSGRRAGLRLIHLLSMHL